MAKYIKCEDAYRTLSNYYHHSTYVQSLSLREALDRVPAADVVERKTGVWIGEGDGYADGNMVYDMWSCGCCGTRFYEWEEEPDWKYCPVCGSYNRGDDDV